MEILLRYCTLLMVVIPWIGGVCCLTIGRKNPLIQNRIGIISVMIEFSLFGLMLWKKIEENRFFSLEIPDICGLGFSFYTDGFRLLYTGIILFMWFMAILFSKEYFLYHQKKDSYDFFVLLTLGATIGVFLANDFFTLFIFFEIMSFASYTWVMQEETKESIKAGDTYLAVAVVSGMVLLMGVFLLYYEVGSLNFMKVHDKVVIGKTWITYVASSCMLFGFGAKAGMFPIHIWLPKAHPVAPAPASALLSGGLTKTGIYGILLLCIFVFPSSVNFGILLLYIGGATMVLGAMLALFSTQLKRLFACSTISQIGFILIGCGMIEILGQENDLAIQGTVLHMVNHSYLKLLFFLMAGVIAQTVHSLNLNEIRGFGYRQTWMKFSFIVGAISMGGLPLGSGYISKTLLHESLVEGVHHFEGTEISQLLFFMECAFMITGGFTVAYLLKVYQMIFTKNGLENWENTYHNTMRQKTVIIVTACMIGILGVLPNVLMNGILQGIPSCFFKETFHYIFYFHMEHIKGAMLSIGIGVFFYFFIVRNTLMQKDENGYLVVERLPKWLDLEELVYRPVLMGVFPFLLALLCRTISRTVDGFVIFLHMTILKPAKTKQSTPVGTKWTDFLGTVFDQLVVPFYYLFHRKKERKMSFVEIFAFLRLEIRKVNRLIGKSISFSLFMACLGLMITLGYLLFGV